jgi:hypothetical protein
VTIVVFSDVASRWAISFRNDKVPNSARFFSTQYPFIVGAYLIDQLVSAKRTVFRGSDDPGLIKCAAAFLFANGISTLDFGEPCPSKFIWGNVTYEVDEEDKTARFFQTSSSVCSSLRQA